MDPMLAVAALGFLLLGLVAVQVAAVVALRRRSGVVREVRVIRVTADDEPVSDDGADYTARQPITVPPHDHVWDGVPFHEDGITRSFRCLVPRCPRVYTRNVR